MRRSMKPDNRLGQPRKRSAFRQQQQRGCQCKRTLTRQLQLHTGHQKKTETYISTSSQLKMNYEHAIHCMKLSRAAPNCRVRPRQIISTALSSSNQFDGFNRAKRDCNCIMMDSIVATTMHLKWSCERYLSFRPLLWCTCLQWDTMVFS